MRISSNCQNAFCSTLLRTMFLVAVGTVLGTPPAPTAAEDQPEAESEAAREQREKRLSQMRERANELQVFRRLEDQRERIELRADPLLRYSDQPRGFVDATLWCWKAEGRPVALAKVEMLVTAARTPLWMHCVASLDDRPIDVAMGSVRYLSTRKAGFELRMVPRAPVAEAKPAARQRQMKELVKRFAATIHAKHRDKQELVPQEMRLLPSPVYRYSGEESGIVDGVIFAFTTNGTNPDVLIVIELRSAKDSPPEWMYGIVNMTAADVQLRLDDAEVLVSRLTDPRETWNYFTTAREE